MGATAAPPPAARSAASMAAYTSSTPATAAQRAAQACEMQASDEAETSKRALQIQVIRQACCTSRRRHRHRCRCLAARGTLSKVRARKQRGCSSSRSSSRSSSSCALGWLAHIIAPRIAEDVVFLVRSGGQRRSSSGICRNESVHLHSSARCCDSHQPWQCAMQRILCGARPREPSRARMRSGACRTSGACMVPACKLPPSLRRSFLLPRLPSRMCDMSSPMRRSSGASAAPESVSGASDTSARDRSSVVGSSDAADEPACAYGNETVA